MIARRTNRRERAHFHHLQAITRIPRPMLVNFDNDEVADLRKDLHDDRRFIS